MVQAVPRTHVAPWELCFPHLYKPKEAPQRCSACADREAQRGKVPHPRSHSMASVGGLGSREPELQLVSLRAEARQRLLLLPG
jgi:hypothetical protein